MEPLEQTHTAKFNKWDSKLRCDSNAINCFFWLLLFFGFFFPKSNAYVSWQLSDVFGSIFPNVLISSFFSEAMVQ